MGFKCQVWGPGLWKSSHIITFNYPESNPTKKQQHDTKQFFTLLGDMLPCPFCVASYKGFIKELPIDNYLGSRAKLTKWLYLIHNKVNRKLRMQGLLNKPDPSFEEVKKHYESFRAKCENKTCRTKLKKNS